MTSIAGNPARPTGMAALAFLVAILGGLLLPKAAFHGLDRGILVWFVVCVACGMTLAGDSQRSFGGRLTRGAAVAGAFMLSVIIFYLTRWVITRIINIDAPSIEIPFGSGASVNILEPRQFPFLMILVAIVYVACFAVITITTFSGRVLAAGIRAVYEFGPEGLERVRKIVAGIVALVTAVIALWAAFG